MFIELDKFTGKIIYENTDYKVVKLNVLGLSHTFVDPLSLLTQGILDVEHLKNLSPLPSVSCSDCITQRHPEYVIMGLSHYHYNIPITTMIDDVEKKIIAPDSNEESISNLNDFLLLLRKWVAIDPDLSSSVLFTQFFGDSISVKAQRYNVATQVEGNHIVFSTTKQDVSLKTNFVVLASEFETIALDLNEEESSLRRKIDFVKERVNDNAKNNRVNPVYFILPYHFKKDEYTPSPRFHINMVGLRSLKTKEMQKFFGCPTRSNTLLDTFSHGLKAFSSKIKDIPVGKKFLIDICSQSTGQSPFAVLPVDYVLGIAPYLKILATDVPDTSSTTIVAECLEQPIGDFHQLLFSSLSEDRNIFVAAFPYEKMLEVVERVKE